MKVKDLIKILSSADPESVVILKKSDGENGFSPVRVATSDLVYVARSKKKADGECYDLVWMAKEADLSEAEWEALKGRSKCVVLHPENSLIYGETT